MRHPITRIQASLETTNRSLAIRRWAMLQQIWEQDRNQYDVNKVAIKLSTTSQVEADPEITLANYLRKWRTEVLGHGYKDGKMAWGDCHVLSQRGRNRGKPIAMASRRDYASDAQQLEASEESDFFLSDPQILRRIRRLLSPWLTKPVRHKFMQISWAEACEAAGFKGQYQLRDLRKKGLTDEFLSQGENNKGGHESPQMRKHYRLIRPPERSKSTLKSLRDTDKL